MEFSAINATIEGLRTASPKPDIFGASHHGFALNPPLPEKDVVAFERKYRIELPADYRRFLTEVGNGGAGPYYGMFRLGERMDMRSLVGWDENDGVVGVLSESFPHTAPWNDLTGEPTEDDENDDQYDEKCQKFYERYFSPRYVNGAVPLSDSGCASSHLARRDWPGGRSCLVRLPVRLPRYPAAFQ